jgi:hypothetical protein
VIHLFSRSVQNDSKSFQKSFEIEKTICSRKVQTNVNFKNQCLPMDESACASREVGDPKNEPDLVVSEASIKAPTIGSKGEVLETIRNDKKTVQIDGKSNVASNRFRWEREINDSTQPSFRLRFQAKPSMLQPHFLPSFLPSSQS